MQWKRYTSFTMKEQADSVVRDLKHFGYKTKIEKTTDMYRTYDGSLLMRDLYVIYIKSTLKSKYINPEIEELLKI